MRNCKTKKQQVFELCEQGRNKKEIAELLPDVARNTVRLYVHEWANSVHGDAKAKPQEAKGTPKKKKRTMAQKRKEEHAEEKKADTLRYECGSGARFSPASVFWKEGKKTWNIRQPY